MAVTVAQAAVALRVIGDPADAVDAATTAILTRQIAVAQALVTAHAMQAPVDVQDEAVIRLVAFLFDQDPALPRANNPIVASGAGAVLAPWHTDLLLGVSVEQAAAAAGITGEQVVRLLVALQGNARLPATAVRDLPEGGQGGGPAVISDGSVTLDKLATDARDVIDDAVQVDGISLTGDDLTFSSDGGGNTTIQLEGAITGFIADWAEQGNTDDIPLSKLGNAPSGGGGGGLSQAQVDARINAAIPAAQRVPSFAQGDANEYVRVNAAGTALDIRPADPVSGGQQTQAQTYAQLQSILQAGQGIDLSADDDDSELTLSSVVPSGNELPHAPHVRDRFILLARDTIHHDLVEFGTTVSPIEVKYDFLGLVGAGPNRIVGYSAGHTTAVFHNKVYLQTSGDYVPPNDAKLVFYQEGGARAEYDVADSAVSGYPHWYEISGLTYANLSDTAHRFALNLTSASAAYAAYPDTAYEPGDYTFAGGTERWVRTPGVAAPWATQGSPQPRLIFDRMLHDGPGIGVSVTNSNAAQTLSPFTLLNPAFDLDDIGQGELHIVATLSIATTSSSTLEFAATESTSIRMQGIVFASALKGLSNYAETHFGSTALRIGVATLVDNGTGRANPGTVEFRMGHNSNGEVGYMVVFRSGAVSNQTFSIAVNLEIAWSPTDPGGSSGASITLLKLNTSGLHGAINYMADAPGSPGIPSTGFLMLLTNSAGGSNEKGVVNIMQAADWRNGVSFGDVTSKSRLALVRRNSTQFRVNFGSDVDRFFALYHIG